MNCTCQQHNEKLQKTIRSFRKDWKVLEDHPVILKSFYEYVSVKFSIKCESGMLRVERCLFQDVLKNLLLRSQGPSLLSSKIRLYAWIEPQHLNVEDKIDLYNVVHLLKDLKNLKSISEMISTYLEVVKSIYTSIGQDREHSVFFSILVISLIKSQETILDKILFLMENFRRSPLPVCEGKNEIEGKNETEGKNEIEEKKEIEGKKEVEGKNEIESRCINKKQIDLNEGEVTYYLTVLKAALRFIEKIEFYDLQITKEEFDEKMNDKR